MRGSWQSAMMRPVSVMPHTSIMGKPKRASNALVQLRLDAGAHAEAHACARSAGPGGWFSSMGATTPR